MNAAQIRALRIRLGLTQKKFADKLGVALNSLNRWENDKSKPSYLAMDRIKKLESAIDKSFE